MSALTPAGFVDRNELFCHFCGEKHPQKMNLHVICVKDVKNFILHVKTEFYVKEHV